MDYTRRIGFFFVLTYYSKWFLFKTIFNSATTGVPTAATGYAVESATAPFKLFHFQRRAPRADDVLIRIHYCGICHTDIHQAHNDWQISKYPMVPGHEITGVVEQVGSSVKHFRAGDHVGVGCMVDSCLDCKFCILFLHMSIDFFLDWNHLGKKHIEQYCPDVCHTFNGLELDKVTPTYGGKHY